jgi:predicted GIY-YIG superfamily endonuclease
MSSQRHVIYIGVTSNIERRVFQHKAHTSAGFTDTYNVTQSGLRRAIRLGDQGDSPGERTEEVAAREESCAD